MRKCAVYNGKEYLYNENNKKKFISTYQKEKTDESFEKSKVSGLFYKEVSDDDLSEIYGYQFIAVYDSNISGVSREWNTVDQSLVIYNNRAQLSFYKKVDFISGWEISERYFYYKNLDFSELLSTRIRFKYEKKAGLICNPPIVQDKDIKPSELGQYNQFYRSL